MTSVPTHSVELPNPEHHTLCTAVSPRPNPCIRAALRILATTVGSIVSLGPWTPINHGKPLRISLLSFREELKALARAAPNRNHGIRTLYHNRHSALENAREPAS